MRSKYRAKTLRKNARRDKNEVDIIDNFVLKYTDATCLEISQGDVPDYLIAYRGSLMLWEIKNPQTKAEKRNPIGMMKDGQLELRNRLGLNKVPVFVVWSTDMALDILQRCKPGKAITMNDRLEIERKHLLKLLP